MGPQRSLSPQTQDGRPRRQPHLPKRPFPGASPPGSGVLHPVPGKVWLPGDSFPGPAARGSSVNRRAPPRPPPGNSELPEGWERDGAVPLAGLC